MLSGTSTVVGAESGVRVYVPAGVSQDSAFPFSAGEEIVIRIDPDDELVIIESGDD